MRPGPPRSGTAPGRARAPMLPSEEQFPYTVRVSDILESNGSSSIASVCGGASADGRGRADQGPGGGIAMGLVMNEETGKPPAHGHRSAEDHYGDMDFKVAAPARA